MTETGHGVTFSWRTSFLPQNLSLSFHLSVSSSSHSPLSDGTQLPSVMALLIAPFCATRLLANYICVNVTQGEKTGLEESRRSKVTQTRWLRGHSASMGSPKLFDEVS